MKQLEKIEGNAGENVDRVDSIYETNRRKCIGKNSYKDVKVTRTVGKGGECEANLTDLRVVKKKKYRLGRPRLLLTERPGGRSSTVRNRFERR